MEVQRLEVGITGGERWSVADGQSWINHCILFGVGFGSAQSLQQSSGRKCHGGVGVSTHPN